MSVSEQMRKVLSEAGAPLGWQKKIKELTSLMNETFDEAQGLLAVLESEAGPINDDVKAKIPPFAAVPARVELALAEVVKAVGAINLRPLEKAIDALEKAQS